MNANNSNAARVNAAPTKLRHAASRMRLPMCVCLLTLCWALAAAAGTDAGGQSGLQQDGSVPQPAAVYATAAEAVGGQAAFRATPLPPSVEQMPELKPALGGWLLRLAVGAALLPLLGWILRRPRVVNTVETPGFEIISDSEQRRFIPLEERYQALDFVNQLETRGSLRLSANLNRVMLSIRRFGYLLEDKNYRNALLVNRRRVRRTLLRDGDVLDLGDLTLLYRDNRESAITRHAPIAPPEGKTTLKIQRLKGPVSRGTPMLVPEQNPNRVFYLTKNVVYVGRSEGNDLVIKSQAIHYRHAKIERVGGRYKLQDLTATGNTFVNNRRTEQRYLKEGDEISFDTVRFKFQLATKIVRERPLAIAAGGGMEHSRSGGRNDMVQDEDTQDDGADAE